MGKGKPILQKVLFIYKMMCFNLFQGKQMLVNKGF